MKLFYISPPRRNPNATASIKKACLDRGVDFTPINPSVFDLTDTSLTPAPGDMLYRASNSSSDEGLAKTVERWLLHDKVATLYSSYERSLTQYPQSYIIHHKHKLSIPKTVWNVPRNRELINKYADYVGGFPVIIKATGGSHGVGVMKIDSRESLYSIIDYLYASDTKVIMRQFIDSRTSARLIVLDGKVIASIEYSAPKDDFRTNVGRKPVVKEKEFSDDVNELAIKAVSSMGYKFGGVDILIDEDGKPYIVEINFPCNFSRAAKATKIDIAGQLVDCLMKESKKYV